MVVVPAVSGPYDLGNVVVRSAIFVDPVTAQVKTVSDPIPSILEGVPLRLRSLLVNLDRPGFALNPTNCDALSVDTSSSGNEGAVFNESSHFQVANCANLDFGPKLGISLKGSTKRRGHPAVRTQLTTGDGEANLKRVVVTMPKNELLDQGHIGTVCTRVQFAANSCPADSVYGTATAHTPLLEQPLTGPVYLRSSTTKLPDLVADLHGQIDIELAGRIDTAKRRRPACHLRLGARCAGHRSSSSNIQGGKKGLLVNSKSLCKATQKATVKMTGQNGSHRQRQGQAAELVRLEGVAT